jgi:rhomboid-related protein 1/2/3
VCDDIVEFIAHWFGALHFAHMLNDDPAAKAPAPARGERLGTKLKQHWSKNKQIPKLKKWKAASGRIDAVTPESGAEQDEELFENDFFIVMHYPIFTFTWTTVVFTLWLLGWIRERRQLAGLESFWPERTHLTIVDVNTCTDYRAEVWRWWTYQFSHAGLTHVGMNSFMVLLFGSPLEGWHGGIRLFFMFQAGVIGGALCWMITANHGSVVGMSGGCYALMGMHFGDILMNFKDKKYALHKVVLLAAFALIDTVQAWFLASEQLSHSAHFGGFVAGCLICTFAGYNKDLLDWEKYVMAAAMVLSIILVSFCLAWGLSWPPMEIWDPVRWCWLRQVKSEDHFGDGRAHCVRCDGQACIDRWSLLPNALISPLACTSRLGGYAVSER